MRTILYNPATFARNNEMEATRVSQKFVPGVFLGVLLPGMIAGETDVFFNVFCLCSEGLI